MLLIPKIQALSNNIVTHNYRKQWVLVQTFPKTYLNIKCLCQSQTKNYRLYFNTTNGNFLILGLDCRNNHNESFTEIGLDETVKDTILNYFLKEIGKEIFNCDNLNTYLKSSKAGSKKNPEIIVQYAVNQMIEEALSKSDIEQAFKETLSIIEMMVCLIDIPKYQKFLKSKKDKLELKMVLLAVEPLEQKSRLLIETTSNQELDEIYEKYRLHLRVNDLQRAQQYLESIPSIIGNNLKQTYPLPEEIWQLQQTNGYKKFISGQFPSFN